MNFPRTVCLIFAALLPVGCGTLQISSEYEPASQTTGQIRWKPTPTESLIANAFFSESEDGKAALLIGKESPEPMLEIVADQTEIASQGPLVGGSWSGPRSMMPTRIAGWVALLDAYATASAMADGTHEIHTNSFRAQYTKDDGRLKQLTVASNDTGESYLVRF